VLWVETASILSNPLQHGKRGVCSIDEYMNIADPLDKYNWIYAGDREEVESEPDPERQEVMAEAISRYRRQDRLEVGDPVPPLALARLEEPGSVRLDGFAGARPLMLIFGSYT